MQFNEETSAHGGGAERDRSAHVRRMRVSEVAELLRQDAEAVAVAVMGQPSSRTRKELRFGRNGSLSVVISGPKRGQCFDHEADVGGDVLWLVQRERGAEPGLEWARRRVGDHGEGRAHAVRNARPIADVAAAKANAEEAEKAAKRAAAQRLLDEAQPIEGTAAAAYLAARLPGADVLGLLRPDALRFHPDHRHDRSKRRFPVMVGAVTEGPDGPLLAVHRTYLHPDPQQPAKAPVEPAKMLLGSPGGGGVWLTEIRPRMVVGEGIETTLSGLAAIGREGWGGVAALSTSGMVNLRLPPEVEDVVFMGDVDRMDRHGKRPGEAAARAAAMRGAAEGRKVSIAFPGPSDGPPCDFNDLWREGGAAAVRAAIEAAEVVPDPTVASDAEHKARIVAHGFSLIEDGPPVPARVHIMDEAVPLPAVLPLDAARRRLDGLVGPWIAAATRAWAGTDGAVKTQTRRLARQDMLALPIDDPRCQPGRARSAYLVARRRHHRADLLQRLDAAGWSVAASAPDMLVVKATVGLGKTEAAIAAVERARGEAPILPAGTWLAPTHNLAQETKARFVARMVPAVVLGGRNQVGPDGTALCDRAALAKRVGAAGLNVRRTLCQGAGEECPFFRTCGYYRQAESVPAGAMVIATHDALATGRLPGGEALAGMVIVDESPLQTLTAKTRTRGLMTDLRRLTATSDDTWQAVAPVLREVDGLLHLPDLAGDGWREWLIARGVTVAGLQEAKGVLCAAIPSTVGSPGNDDAIVFGLHRAEAGIRDKRKVAALLEALARDWGSAGRDVQSLRVGWGAVKDPGEPGEEGGGEPDASDQARFWFAINPPAQVPPGVSLLALDATADDGLARTVLGTGVGVERIEALQHLAVTQVTRPSFSMRQLGLVKGQSKSDREAGELRQEMALELVQALVTRHGRGKVAVITYNRPCIPALRNSQVV